jgi:hypothetical protein
VGNQNHITWLGVLPRVTEHVDAGAWSLLFPNAGSVVAPWRRAAVSGNVREKMSVVVGNECCWALADTASKLPRVGVRSKAPVPKVLRFEWFIVLWKDKQHSLIIVRERRKACLGRTIFFSEASSS